MLQIPVSDAAGALPLLGALAAQDITIADFAYGQPASTPSSSHSPAMARRMKRSRERTSGRCSGDDIVNLREEPSTGPWGREAMSRPARRPVHDTLVFAWRAILKIRHTPEQAFDVVVTPIMFTVLFAYLFGGALMGSVDAYLQFLLPALSCRR